MNEPAPQTDRRLLGAWKSDRLRTFKGFTPSPDASAEAVDKLKAIFGKLVVRWEPRAFHTDLDGIKESTAYEIVASDSESVVIRFFDAFFQEQRLKQIYFEGDHYWIWTLGCGMREYFKRVRSNRLASHKRKRRNGRRGPMPMNAVGRLKAHWTAQGVTLRSGVPSQKIEEFESRHQVRFPSDLREYFTAVDGMEPGQVDESMFSFLPLHSVKAIPEELAHFAGIPDYTEIMRTLPNPQHWFVIVDYLICSAVYAIRLSPGSDDAPVLWIGDGTRHHQIATSFSGFLETYLADPNDLL